VEGAVKAMSSTLGEITEFHKIGGKGTIRKILPSPRTELRKTKKE
jgi:hypothetical protein